MNRYFYDLKYRLKSIRNLKIIIFMLVLINGLIGGSIYFIYPVTYFNSLLLSLDNPFYPVIIFIILSYVAKESLNNFDRHHPLVGRYKNRNQYLEGLLKQVLFDVITVFLISLIILMSIRRIFFTGLPGIENYIGYDIPDFIYFFFFIIRYFMIYILLIVTFILVSKSINKIAGIIYAFLIVMIFFVNWPVDTINHFSFDIFLVYVYTSLISYPSFANEICYSSLFLLFLMTSAYGLYYWVKKKQADIG